MKQKKTDAESIDFKRGYDAGRYANPNIFEIFEKNYYKQQKENANADKAELEIKIMNTDKINALEQELMETKDKYIRLLEEVYSIN